MELPVKPEVGTIVWVRRRNGSWWPGKILGSEELSASHLMSPHSGTPVKLLGRQDASVDWYSFKRSKRVKPFRCPEFHHCIQCAKAFQGMPPKKLSNRKYIRREDAILHALQLEKQLLNNNCKPVSSYNDGNVDLLPQDDMVQRKRPGLEEEEEEDNKDMIIQPSPKLSLDSNEGNRRSVRVTRVPARLMEYENDLSPRDTIHRKSPSHDDNDQPSPTLSDTMPLQLLVAAAASSDSSDHTPDNLLIGKTKRSPEDEETDSSRTESLSSDTYDATLSASSTGRGIDADTNNKQLVDHLQKELLNQKQRNQQMQTELVAFKRERDFALSELEEVRQQLKKQQGGTGEYS